MNEFIKEYLNVYKEMMEDKTIIGKIFIGFPLWILFTFSGPILIISILICIPFMLLFDKFDDIGWFDAIRSIFYK